MIEVEVHQQLRAFLREQGESHWPHHLTMARLVARALRLGRSALIQTGPPSGYYGRYRLSYLVPLLIWPESAILVVPEAIQRRLIQVEIPRLRQWITLPKAIRTGDRWPNADFRGLLLTSPQDWLRDRIEKQGRFPAGIPTIIDSADDLESWIRQQLTTQLTAADWEALMLAYPDQQDAIRDARIQLTHAVFRHPENPYDCHLVDAPEQEVLQQLYQALVRSTSGSGSDGSETNREAAMPEVWQQIWQQLQQPNSLVWATIARQQGQFTLHCGPIDVATPLASIWEQQPLVLIGGALELDTDAPIYRQRLGLGDMTCLKFSPHRQHELIQLYLPDNLPLPNHPQYQAALLHQVRTLLYARSGLDGPCVILVGDTPLKAQVGAALAAEFGSRVQVEKTCLDDNGILVAGWDFWQQYQGVLPAPPLLVIATLPIPSLEHPLVAGRVAHYKRQRQDWFRLYLLPEALSELQRAIAPVRDCQGVVALLDNRVNHRSYGNQVLAAMSPAARINYMDASLFDTPNQTL